MCAKCEELERRLLADPHLLMAIIVDGEEVVSFEEGGNVKVHVADPGLLLKGLGKIHEVISTLGRQAEQLQGRMLVAATLAGAVLAALPAGTKPEEPLFFTQTQKGVLS